MEPRTIIIGTRGSDLALWQANFVRSELERIGLKSELKIIKTSGDQIQHLGFDKMEGKGFFTKELEEALLRSEIDLAVHSHKDLETTSPPGLTIAAVSHRADPRDLLIIRKEVYDASSSHGLPKGARIGTSSARRKALMLDLFEDIELADLRGNVPTRVQKLRDKQYDAILLAKAGVDRLDLDLSEFTCIPLEPELFVPAPAQGVLAIQTRDSDIPLIEKLAEIGADATIPASEREVLRIIQGGCQLPLGAYCTALGKDRFELHVAFAQAWNEPVQRFRKQGSDPMSMAQEIARSIRSSYA